MRAHGAGPGDIGAGMAGNVLPLTTQIGERIDRIMIEQGNIVPPADRSAIDPGQRDPAAVIRQPHLDLARRGQGCRGFKRRRPLRLEEFFPFPGFRHVHFHAPSSQAGCSAGPAPLGSPGQSRRRGRHPLKYGLSQPRRC